jgi:hypothetical protein
VLAFASSWRQQNYIETALPRVPAQALPLIDPSTTRAKSNSLWSRKGWSLNVLSGGLRVRWVFRHHMPVLNEGKAEQRVVFMGSPGWSLPYSQENPRGG